jgi:hypothetical protein
MPKPGFSQAISVFPEDLAGPAAIHTQSLAFHRFQCRLLEELADLGTVSVIIAAAWINLLKNVFMTMPASVVFPSGNQRFKDVRRIWFEEPSCTKPSKAIVPGVSGSVGEHAHEITDTDARQPSRSRSRAFNRSENV